AEEFNFEPNFLATSQHKLTNHLNEPILSKLVLRHAVNSIGSYHRQGPNAPTKTFIEVFLSILPFCADFVWDLFADGVYVGDLLLTSGMANWAAQESVSGHLYCQGNHYNNLSNHITLANRFYSRLNAGRVPDAARPRLTLTSYETTGIGQLHAKTFLARSRFNESELHLEGSPNPSDIGFTRARVSVQESQSVTSIESAWLKLNCFASRTKQHVHSERDAVTRAVVEQGRVKAFFVTDNGKDDPQWFAELDYEEVYEISLARPNTVPRVWPRKKRVMMYRSEASKAAWAAGLRKGSTIAAQNRTLTKLQVLTSATGYQTRGQKYPSSGYGIFIPASTFHRGNIAVLIDTALANGMTWFPPTTQAKIKQRLKKGSLPERDLGVSIRVYLDFTDSYVLEINFPKYGWTYKTKADDKYDEEYDIFDPRS
ncbi:hypothetical protein JCM11641_006541, partial [Rhodosporidiobolus odoratus]